MTSETAATVLGALVVGVVGGGAWFSVTSAVRGPRWALSRSSLLAIAGVVLGVVGSGLWLLGGQPWLGLATVYMGMMVLLMGRLLRRMLQRMNLVGGLDDVGTVVRAAVIRKAKFGLLVGGVAFLAGGLLVEGTLSLIMLGIAVALGLNWVGLRLVATRP